ncbi:MAG: cytochrome C assembly protein, partial [Bacillati bacterium ANGP1]
MIRSADVALASGSCVAMLLALYGAFVFAPTERVMGDVQRIFYVHLPLAWIGFVAFGHACWAGIQYLRIG